MSVEFPLVASRADCECYFSWEKGFFRLGESGEGDVYGRDPPPVCDRCTNSLFGPTPGTTTASATGRLVACNVLGGQDPNEV